MNRLDRRLESANFWSNNFFLRGVRLYLMPMLLYLGWLNVTSQAIWTRHQLLCYTRIFLPCSASLKSPEPVVRPSTECFTRLLRITVKSACMLQRIKMSPDDGISDRYQLLHASKSTVNTSTAGRVYGMLKTSELQLWGGCTWTTASLRLPQPAKATDQTISWIEKTLSSPSTPLASCICDRTAASTKAYTRPSEKL